MNQENNALVSQILSTAADECARVQAQAEAYAEEMKQRAKRDAEDFLLQREQLATAEAQEFVKRKETLATLDAKKLLLGVKQEIVDGIYRRAVGRLNNLSEAQYLAFLDGLVARYAEDGDTVVFAQNCPISKDKLSALPSIKARNLAVSFEGKFTGGLVLSGGSCDKSLTFESVCQVVREETEAELSKTLFGAK